MSDEDHENGRPGDASQGGGSGGGPAGGPPNLADLTDLLVVAWILHGPRRAVCETISVGCLDLGRDCASTVLRDPVLSAHTKARCRKDAGGRRDHTSRYPLCMGVIMAARRTATTPLCDDAEVARVNKL